MDAVDRMFQVLVAALRKTNPALLTSPFTVADVHQHIIPYRHFRHELGLPSNHEYELTLMSLLSGERGYLDVDERLRDALRIELASSTPEPSRVRDFADAQVSLNVAALGDPGHSAPAASSAAASKQAGASTATPVSSPSQGAGGTCRYCGGELPTGRALNYCPHCGQNLQVHHCPACGAELESGWRFCVACGKSVS